jgi:hypothetical protein
VKHIILAIALGAAAAGPAAAQAVYSSSVEIMPPQEAAAVVRAMGFDPIGRPVWRPGRYLVRAIDPSGQDVRVAIDARMGDVISVRPVMPAMGAYYEDGPPAGAYEPYPRYARPYRGSDPRVVRVPPRFEDEDVAELPPPDATPRVITAPRGAVPHASSAMPARTPLPRPRPVASLASAPSQEPVAAAPAKVPAPPVKPDESRAGEGASSWPPVQPLDDVTPATPRF